MWTLEHERYQAVRYTTHKALRALYGAQAEPYDSQGSAAERARQLRALRETLEAKAKLDRDHSPPLSHPAADLFSEEVFDRLLKARNDPDVFINE
jgi:hypothetical protein